MPGEQALLMDATAEKVAFILRAPKTGTLHKVRFRTGTVTTGDTLKVSFQDLDLTTGFPDGVADQFRTIVIADANDNTSLVTGILSNDGTDGGTKRAVTMGDRLAVVFEFNSWVAGNLNIIARNSQTPSAASNGAYVCQFTAAWAKVAANLCRVALEYSDGSYEAIPYVCPAVGSIPAETYNSSTIAGSGGDERGMIFQVPFGCSVSGAWAFLDVDGEGELVLYDSDGTSVLLSVSLDPEARNATAGAVFHELFNAETTLQINTSYRLSWKPTTTTNASIYVGDYTAAEVLDALPGGQECHYTARTDAGAWSETTTKRPLMGLILSALENPDSGTTMLIWSGEE